MRIRVPSVIGYSVAKPEMVSHLVIMRTNSGSKARINLTLITDGSTISLGKLNTRKGKDRTAAAVAANPPIIEVMKDRLSMLGNIS